MHTRPPVVTIDVNENKAGNLLAMTDALCQGFDSTDTIATLVAKIDTPGVTMEDVSVAPHAMCRKLILRGAKNKQLVLEYNTQSGDYEISINDFGITEISQLRILVERVNLNRMLSRPAATLTV